MKKVLFATTALVATAGVAAADVTLSGSGRFGVVYNSGRNATGTAAQVTAANAAASAASCRAAF